MKKTIVVLLLAVSVAQASPKKSAPVVQPTNILWGTRVVWGDWLDLFFADNILWGT